jgi:hypothetical protein
MRRTQRKASREEEGEEHYQSGEPGWLHRHVRRGRVLNGLGLGDKLGVEVEDRGGRLSRDGRAVGGDGEEVGQFAVGLGVGLVGERSVQEIKRTIVVGRDAGERRGSRPQTEGVSDDEIEGDAEGCNCGHTKDGDHRLRQLMLRCSEAGAVDGVPVGGTD